MLGLRDFTKAERTPGFKIYMGDWYKSNTHCTICFAGAVMAFSLKRGAHGGSLVPDSFDRNTALKLRALDQARAGKFESAVLLLHDNSGVPSDDASKARGLSRYIPDYSNNKTGFKKGIRKAAIELRAVGL